MNQTAHVCNLRSDTRREKNCVAQLLIKDHDLIFSGRIAGARAVSFGET
jgi:hypothetical protein